MSETEAKFRIIKIKKISLEIVRGLEELESVMCQSKNEEKAEKKFIFPFEEEIVNKRWKSCCTLTSQQLFGINQKISSCKLQLEAQNEDIETLRNLSQLTQKCNEIIKRLLQYPDALRANRESAVVIRSVAACKCLLQLLIDAEFIKDVNSHVSGNEETESLSNSYSVIDSAIVHQLEEENCVQKHIQALADAQFSTSSRAESSCPMAGSDLGDGRSIHFLHDSLSNKLTARHYLDDQRVTEVCNQNVTQPVKLITRKLKQKRYVKGSKEARIATREHSTIVSDGRKDATDLNEREQLWQQLMPLLLHQNAFLNAHPDLDIQGLLEQLDELLQRLNSVDVNVAANRELVQESAKIMRINEMKPKETLQIAFRNARSALSNAGFLNLDKADNQTTKYEMPQKCWTSLDNSTSSSSYEEVNSITVDQAISSSCVGAELQNADKSSNVVFEDDNSLELLKERRLSLEEFMTHLAKTT